MDRALRLSPIDPLRYAMLATRAFTHLSQGEYEDAARWAERGASSPGAHVLIVMLAAGLHRLAGDPRAAACRAAEAQARDAALGYADFFRSFPLQPPPVRTRMEDALAGLGFARA